MEVRINEPMKRHTTFRAGGEADWFAVPETPGELQAVLSLCQRAGMDWYIIGNGSNILVSDEGYHGMIINTGRFLGLEITGTTMKAGSGVLLSRLANAALQAGLTGLEFAAGIPGTVGGSAAMNAGAYGSEMKDILSFVTVLTGDGQIMRMEKEDLHLGYRTSSIMENRYVVLAAEYSLKPGDTEKIKSRMEDLAAKRREKQPLEYPSAGSMFKRPEGYFAGKLIEDAGLKGFCVGKAAVSEKHAGFVINKGEATAADIYRLCREVTRRVKEAFGVTLEMEVKLLGKFE